MGKWVCHSLPVDGDSSNHWGSEVGPRAADMSHSLSLHKNPLTQAAIFPVQPNTPRAHLSWHHSSPCFYDPHKAWDTYSHRVPTSNTAWSSPLEYHISGHSLELLQSNMFPHMLEPFCNSSICFWEIWKNLMIFSGVVKPTAVVINRGHS